MIPPHPQRLLFNMIVTAMIGSYGLTFISIGVLALLFNVLHELRLG